jgi:hypothetical protein
MKKKSKPEKSTNELTPSTPVPPPSPISIDEKASSAGTSATPTSGTFFPLVNDSTSHIEISLMANDKYSQEIIGEASKVFSLRKLQALKNDKDKFLKEAKVQINKLCQSISALEAHDQLFKVTFLIHLGDVLNEIEPAFQRKSAYINWLKSNFAGRSPEYFQHARRLAKMGNTAIKYRSLGVNRLLDVDRLERALEKSLDDILKTHAFPDTSEDFGGILFTAQIDAILSYYRFKNVAVDNITMEQALQLAQYFHKAVEVREVKRFKKGYDEAPDKDAFLNKYVMDKMAVTGDGEAKSVSGESLNKILAGLNDYFQERVNDSEWLGNLKKLLDRSIFYESYGHLTWLKKKLMARPHKSRTLTKKSRR